MTSITAFTGIRQYLAYLNYFVTNRISYFTNDSRHPLQAYLDDSSIFLVEHFHIIREGHSDQPGLLDIRFRLSQADVKNFVLLRGLFEFSRPGGIDITSDLHSRSFELRLPEDQVPAIASYLQAISDRFRKEIAFKASLRKILHFEKAMKAEQAKLYRNLQASA